MLKPISFSLGALPYYPTPEAPSGTGPARKRLLRPETSRTFVKPLRQSLFKDARLMPGTLRLLCLLAGWQGAGRPIETTLGALARQLQRSERQIQRYIKDAAEEGYLFCSKVANRLGYIVGLRLRINPAAVYAPKREAEIIPGVTIRRVTQRLIQGVMAPKAAEIRPRQICPTLRKTYIL